jgi:hypothetical protein
MSMDKLWMDDEWLKQGFEMESIPDSCSSFPAFSKSGTGQVFHRRNDGTIQSPAKSHADNRFKKNFSKKYS